VLSNSGFSVGVELPPTSAWVITPRSATGPLVYCKPSFAVTEPFGTVTCGINLGLRMCCGIVDVDADGPAKADASLALFMLVGSHASGALAVACLAADPSWSFDAGLDPVREMLIPTRTRADPRPCTEEV
jgi:hypothetical protein